MTRVAAIDCGTNSIRLLVADLEPGAAQAVDIARRMEIVRLGEKVDETGRLAPQALERTFTALRAYERTIEELGVELVRMVATSASRDASNRAEFVDGVEMILGVTPEVISGAEEASLSFLGATRGLSTVGAGPPYLVVDIGGGSTELVLGTDRVTAARSVDVGSVRMTERHLTDDPPTPGQIAAARADIERALDVAAAEVPLTEARTLVGVAGTVTTVTGVALGLDTYDSSRVHLSRLPADVVIDWSQRLLSMPRAEIAKLTVIHPGRVDVIAAGSLVLRAVLERVGLPELITSEHDILDGIAWSLV